MRIAGLDPSINGSGCVKIELDDQCNSTIVELH